MRASALGVRQLTLKVLSLLFLALLEVKVADEDKTHFCLLATSINPYITIVNCNYRRISSRFPSENGGFAISTAVTR